MVKSKKDIKDLGIFSVLNDIERAKTYAINYTNVDIGSIDYKVSTAYDELRLCVEKMVETGNCLIDRKKTIPEDVEASFISAMSGVINTTDTITSNGVGKPFKHHKYAKDITFNRINAAIKKGLREEASAKERGDAYNEHEAYALLNNLWWYVYITVNPKTFSGLLVSSDVRKAVDAITELEDHDFTPRVDPEPEKPTRRAPNGQDELAFTEPTDIVITDPCYFVPDSDWQASGYGESLPFPHITKETGYGDWYCDVISTDTGGSFGTFTADAGMCVVATLSDIKRSYPNALNSIPKCCYAIIRGFTGTVKTKRDILYGNLIVIGKGSINFRTEIAQ